MKSLKIPNLRPFGIALLVASAITSATVVGHGQTRRKRVPPPAVPTTPAGEAQIISRAEDFPDSDTTLVVKQDEKKPEIRMADPDENARALADLRTRLTGLESAGKANQDAKQKRLLLNLDILNRAEQRSESLRKQLFDMIEKESTIKTRLDIIEMNVRPEAIDREVALAGTLRPEDLRAMKKKQLEVERTNLQTVLTEIQKTKTTLEQNLQRSDAMVEKLRVKLEKEIDDALADDPVRP